jgi:hypothetical protein
MDSCLNPLFCSTDLHVCFCFSTILFLLLWLCSIVWSWVLWYLQHCCSWSFVFPNECQDRFFILWDTPILLVIFVKKQVLYNRSHSSFCFSYFFFDNGLIFPRSIWTMILLFMPPKWLGWQAWANQAHFTGYDGVPLKFGPDWPHTTALLISVSWAMAPGIHLWSS